MCGLCRNPVCSGFSHTDRDVEIAISPGTSSSRDSAPASLSLGEIIDQLNRGDFTWGADANVTYSFATTREAYTFGDPEYIGFLSFNDQQQDHARLALEAWSDVANISFTETSPNTGTISFSNSSTLAPSSAAHAYYPSGLTSGGDIWVNSDFSYNTLPEIGNYGFLVLLHEIGHAIGQPHPSDYVGAITYESSAAYAEDSEQYTVMSYFDETNTGANFLGNEAQTPMLHDIAAIQAKYGADMSTRIGDTVYGFNSNTNSKIFDFAQNSVPVMSIWDAGGNDTIDTSGFSQDAILSLIAGQFSSIAGMTNNLSIAYGALVENAETGAGNDTIYGNAVSNNVDGNGGLDTFVMGAAIAEASIVSFTNGDVIVSTASQVDKLSNIETISLTDQTLSVDGLAPVSAYAYGASYGDLINAFGSDYSAYVNHYRDYGISEGREFLFNPESYLTANPDLVSTLSTNGDDAALHYIQTGYSEGRRVSFDSWAYLAANGDLIEAFGADTNAAYQHYASFGFYEPRDYIFDSAKYLAYYDDLQAAFGNDLDAATQHFVQYGYNENRFEWI